jgi:hypothetical protein
VEKKEEGVGWGGGGGFTQQKIEHLVWFYCLNRLLYWYKQKFDKETM